MIEEEEPTLQKHFQSWKNFIINVKINQYNIPLWGDNFSGKKLLRVGFHIH
jgi:ATP-dependent RNA circularization protein (DNA/RNA ligase family)